MAPPVPLKPFTFDTFPVITPAAVVGTFSFITGIALERIGFEPDAFPVIGFRVTTLCALGLTLAGGVAYCAYELWRQKSGEKKEHTT